MSQTHTISQPLEPLTSTTSRVPPPLAGEEMSAVLETVERLRAELAGTSDRGRQARLLLEIANLEERAGDEPGAARDYLAAYNADQTFREPLEGLVRLLEKRRSLKNLGKLVDALVRVAATPDEKVRALLMRAAYQGDVAGDWGEARISAHEATQVEGAATAEQASAWLSFEIVAGRSGDVTAREAALAERTRFAHDPGWRALLLIDRARMALAAADGADQADQASALSLLDEARSLASATTWAATTLFEQVAGERAAAAGADEARVRADGHADALESVASLLEQAVLDGSRGDALGVPRWARQPARLVDAWLRAADARRRLGQFDRAGAILDGALSYLAGLAGDAGADGREAGDASPDGAPAVQYDEVRLAEGAVVSARTRIAEQTGDTALAARLAERRLESEKDPELSAALAMRVAEHAASEGDAPRAFEALSRAVTSDAGCLPARALQLDMLADGGDSAAFAAQLESFADHLSTDEARGRAFLLASYVWAVNARDVAGAKAALSQAALYGVVPATTARIARALASVAEDLGWYEEATKRLLASGAEDRELVSLYVELVRLRHGRGDAEGEAKALRDMAATPSGAWLARVLEAFLPRFPHARPDAPGAAASATAGPARTAMEELVGLEKDADRARGLGLVAAFRALADGDAAAARRQLSELAERDPSDLLVASMLADLHRLAADHGAAARIASNAAALSTDADLAAALRLESAFGRWREGDRQAAIEEMEAAIPAAPEAAKLVLAWAGRGVDVDSLAGRRRALERAANGGAAVAGVLALERFALETGGDADAAANALAAVDRAPGADLGVAGALARLVWSPGAADLAAAHDAIARIAGLGPTALPIAAAERARVAREAGEREELTRAGRAWFEAGGGLVAALEWLAAAIASTDSHEEVEARLAVAATLEGEAREAMLASAALTRWLGQPDIPAPVVIGESAAVRLANLELAPAGCDPRRRAKALTELDGALGDEAGVHAVALSGWSALVAGDVTRARTAFEESASAQPTDLAAWEGLRACAELTGDATLRARAAAELGARCQDAERSAAFWEEAGVLWLEVGDEGNADRSLDESFARDPKRAIAFDKLFRRVRARKDNDKLLAMITRRLEVTDDTQEIQKLFWEQARVLREKGDYDGALKALEHVTMLDPDHVGALALLGEINIRRGQYEEAATSLARLAMLDGAPARNRVTAGVAAVDLYENKLDRHDKALEVLLSLHRAKISTLPVRERLARAAARTGAWNEATAMLEELMNERADSQGRMEAARLSMTIHRDRLGSPRGAAAAISKLLEESPADGEALDMLLETDQPPELRGRLLEKARGKLVELLQNAPTDATAVRRLANVAKALSDDALHQAALGALVSLGAADARSEQTLVQLASKKSRSPQIAITQETLRALLAPGDEGPVAELFTLLGPTLAEALGPTLQTCGVGRRDKVDPRSGLALRNEIAAWAGAFGVHEFDLYVGGTSPLGVQGIAGAPASLVVGTGIKSPIAPLVRARIAREFVAIVRGTTVARLRDDITIAAIVVTCCKLAETPIQHPPYAVLAEVERLVGKAIPRRTRKLLAEPCRAIATRGADARAWGRRALASHDRVAAIASGDASVVLGDVLAVTAENLGQTVRGSQRAEELLRFVLSPQYLQLRRSLGLEGGDVP